MLADQQPVGDRREDADDAAHGIGVERCDGQVHEHERRAIAQGRRHRLHGRPGPAHERLIEEGARVLVELAPAVVPDPAARTEDHPLRAARPRDVGLGLHRRSLPAPPPPKRLSVRKVRGGFGE